MLRTTKLGKFGIQKSSFLQKFLSHQKRFLNLGSTPKSAQVATVFGATGLSGRYIVNLLVNDGVQVVIPYRDSERQYRHLKVLGEVGQVIPLMFSIRDEPSIKHSIAHSQVVINLLGRHYDTYHYKLNEANVQSAKKIATAAKEAGIQRFIHVSALGAAPDSPSAFLRSKYESELAVKEVFPQATILRPGPFFGDIYDQFLSKFGVTLEEWRPFMPIPIPTTTTIQPLAVTDFANAVIAAVNSSESAGQTYELGGPKTYTIEEIIDDMVYPLTRTEGGITVPIPTAFLKRLFIAKYAFKKRPLNAWTQDDPAYWSVSKTVAPHSLTIQHLGIKRLVPLEDLAEATLNAFIPIRTYEAASPSGVRANTSIQSTR